MTIFITLPVLLALVLALLSCFGVSSRAPLLPIAVVCLALVEFLRLGLLS